MDASHISPHSASVRRAWASIDDSRDFLKSSAACLQAFWVLPLKLLVFLVPSGSSIRMRYLQPVSVRCQQPDPRVARRCLDVFMITHLLVIERLFDYASKDLPPRRAVNTSDAVNRSLIIRYLRSFIDRVNPLTFSSKKQMATPPSSKGNVVILIHYWRLL